MVRGLSGKPDTVFLKPSTENAQAGIVYGINKAVPGYILQNGTGAIAAYIAYGQRSRICRVAATRLYIAVWKDEQDVPRPTAPIFLKPPSVPWVFEFLRLTDRGDVYLQKPYEDAWAFDTR